MLKKRHIKEAVKICMFSPLYFRMSLTERFCTVFELAGIMSEKEHARTRESCYYANIADMRL